MKRRLFAILGTIFLSSCTVSTLDWTEPETPRFQEPSLRDPYPIQRTVEQGSAEWKKLSQCRWMINHECVGLQEGAFKMQKLEVGERCYAGMDFLIYGEGYILWRKHMEPGTKLEHMALWVPYNATLFVGMGDKENDFKVSGCYVAWSGEPDTKKWEQKKKKQK